jgi:pantetheine-phosphate adenylyltransferase
MKKALFTGTFDPPTLGHVDIIRRCASICDKLYVGIAIHPNKAQLFSIQERKHMLKMVCHPFPYAEIVDFSTLAVDFARQHDVDFLIRGLRAFSDFEYEFRMALANRRLSGIETVFLMADERMSHISSTLIRELGNFKSRLHDFVPAEIEEMVFQRVSCK